MDTINNRPAVLIASASEVREIEDAMNYNPMDDLEEQEEVAYSSLASHISSVFQKNRDARRVNGIEEKLFSSLRAYNGHYDPQDLARIREAGGSEIYMNLTATKCRATMSWIRDFVVPARDQAWGLEPTIVPELPPDIVSKIEASINEATKPQSTPEGAESPNKAVEVASSLRDINQMKRDIEDAIYDEIYKVASSEVKKFERIVADQLQEGDWDRAISEFIEDFCIFQTAFLKGPVITKKKRLTYNNGRAEEVDNYIFLNKRVSPFDIYPSPNASNITDGDLCEHVRFDTKTLYKMIGVQNYKEDVIRDILSRCEEGGSTSNGFDSNIEQEKNEEEYKDHYTKDTNTIHGIHFHGSIPWRLLDEWGFDSEKIGVDEDAVFEVEAILADNEVIKCVLNSDPLLRRPYYKASFQNIPGSFWGRSLPELMHDIQRMCNATARALANNMGVASGPQIEIYTDRLADDTEINDIKPFQIWQLTSDPTGAGGRAVNFWQPTSNASELLAVYKEFELRADDATGVPRYAYGGDRNGGSAQTASGLSMLLESASKGIKDAIRNIDLGVIKPRVEYQFYWNVISDDNNSFTGDVNVVPRGSEILTLKGASEMRRNEFLQILANPMYAEVVGMEGVADILREMAKSLGLGRNIIPSRVELRKKQEDTKAAQAQQQQQQAQADQGKTSVGLEATKLQVQAQVAMQENAQKLKMEELKLKQTKLQSDRDLRIAEIQQAKESAISKETAALQKQQMIETSKEALQNKDIALAIKTNESL